MTTIEEILNWYRSRGNKVLIGEIDLNQVITVPRAIDAATENNISFISKKLADKFDQIILSTKAILIVVDEDLIFGYNEKKLPLAKALVISKNPKTDIIDFCKAFLNFGEPVESTVIHPNACIMDDAIIGDQVKIDAFVVIEENVRIGSRSYIGANTVIKKNTIIGDDVEIGSCNVIGGVGFGYAKMDDKNEYEQLPHYGKVILKNKVHIGNNTCIDRGSFSDTIIEEGAKIDNLVHIAHNVIIGKNSLVIACSMVAGSVVIGENCWVAPCSTIRNAITIGNQVTIGLSSTVTKDVPDNQIVIGSPAVLMEEFLRLRKQQKKFLEENQ